MHLTPKSIRLLSIFQDRLKQSKDRIIWRHWAMENPAGADATPQIAEIALQLAHIAQDRLNKMLESGRLDEDREADAANDLQFFRAIERTYEREHAAA